MTREDIENSITRVLAENCVFDFEWDDTFRDLDVDSLELIECAMDLEDVLNIDIPDRSLVDVKTPKDLVNVIMGVMQDDS